ncbi:hypothetical protein [Kitasatospora arboriphila]|uniref:Uncharacterized protein n=1 Tax=Kitasatospora arboriphila TaxID=258052 RepID=A0ABN1U4R5_9ACTN
MDNSTEGVADVVAASFAAERIAGIYGPLPMILVGQGVDRAMCTALAARSACLVLAASALSPGLCSGFTR